MPTSFARVFSSTCSFVIGRSLALLPLLALASAGCGKSGPPPKDPDLPPQEGRVGVHAMVAFGPNTEGGMYLANIPTYSQPNDMQFVMRAHVTTSGTDFVPKKMNDGLYTLEPDTFSLDKLVAGQTLTFQGNLYIGNFQEHAKPLTHGMRVDIDSMVFPPRPLESSSPHMPEPNYVAFGRIGALYLVHLITGAPDYDQILFGHVVSGIDDMALARAATLVNKGKPNDVVQRLHSGDKVGLTTLDNKIVQIEIERELSCSTGDEFTQSCPR